ncbi:unnamed protein product, partial [Phaeothamnion confervicola]
DGSLPSRDRSQYTSSTWWSAPERVLLRPEDDAFREACGASVRACRIRAAVYGFVETEYSITAGTAAAAVTLLGGRPVAAVVAEGKYEYFDITQRDPGEVSIAVTPSSGDVRLFVGCGPSFAFPNATHHTWRLHANDGGDGGGGDSGGGGDGGGDGGGMLVLSTGARDTCTPPTTYHASVYGLTLATFTIVAGVSGAGWSGGGGNSTGPGDVVVLLPGLSQTGTAGYGEFRYFEVRRRAGDGPVRVRAAATGGGAVGLYVSASWETRP